MTLEPAPEHVPREAPLATTVDPLAVNAAEEDLRYSLVVPFFNESGCAAALLREITAVMQGLGAAYEVILVNDGSTDATAAILRGYVAENPVFRLLDIAANRGQAAALYAGLMLARAPVVITMDGDGQNDPRDVPALLDELRGKDMVVGVRVDRQDAWWRRAMSRVANRIRRRILRDGVDDSGCALKVFRREVIDALLPIATLYSFMPAMAVAGGFAVVQRPVAHRSRTAGASSYGIRSFFWRPIVDTAGMWWFTRRSFAVRARHGGLPPGDDWKLTSVSE
jgi:glycosyltransferase involved in cell wall biosynthesis